MTENDHKPAIVIVINENPPQTHPCLLGVHHWAWMTNGRQVCGYCGVRR